MTTNISFTDSDGDVVQFAPSANQGDIYVETWHQADVNRSEAHIVRLEPAQIEVLVDYLIDMLYETQETAKWPGYVSVEEA